MSTTFPFPHQQGQPAWDVAHLYPVQGKWTELEYLTLTHSTNHLVEFTDGAIEVLPMPTEAHQLIMVYLLYALGGFLSPQQLGLALPAGIRVRLPDGKFREPDIAMMLAEHAERRTNEYWNGADLVMEIVSDDPVRRRRDLEDKRSVYAEAGIPEYWIVDPKTEQITVLKLKAERYTEHGVFLPGTEAISALLPGFAVDVASVFRSAHQ
jgi:Uma2 family endonuclease